MGVADEAGGVAGAVCCMGAALGGAHDDGQVVEAVQLRDAVGGAHAGGVAVCGGGRVAACGGARARVHAAARSRRLCLRAAPAACRCAGVCSSVSLPVLPRVYGEVHDRDVRVEVGLFATRSRCPCGGGVGVGHGVAVGRGGPALH